MNVFVIGYIIGSIIGAAVSTIMYKRHSEYDGVMSIRTNGTIENGLTCEIRSYIPTSAMLKKHSVTYKIELPDLAD